MTRVKICGLTRAEDVQRAVAAGAWATGFVHVPGSKRYVDAERLETLAQAAGPSVLRVAVLSDSPLDEALRLARSGHLDVLQLHGHEDVDYVRVLTRHSPETIAVWKALQVERAQDLVPAIAFAPHVAALVLDSGTGTGRPFDWGLLDAWTCPAPLILAGGLTPENAHGAVLRVRPAALDVASGTERAPGVKDIERLLAFMAAVRGADRFLAL